MVCTQSLFDDTYCGVHHLLIHSLPHKYTNFLCSYLYQRLFSFHCINLCPLIQNVLHLKSLEQLQFITLGFAFQYLLECSFMLLAQLGGAKLGSSAGQKEGADKYCKSYGLEVKFHDVGSVGIHLHLSNSHSSGNFSLPLWSCSLLTQTMYFC